MKQSFYFLRSKTSWGGIEGYQLVHKVFARLFEGCNYCISGIKQLDFVIAYREEPTKIRSCLCIVDIDGNTTEARIVHTHRGKFKILADNFGGIYTGRIVDASDVIRCIL